MMPALWQKARGTKEPLDESEREEWKAGLKLNIHCQTDGEWEAAV